MVPGGVEKIICSYTYWANAISKLLQALNNLTSTLNLGLSYPPDWRNSIP